MPRVLDVAQVTDTPMYSGTAIPLRVEGLDSLPRMGGPYVSFVTPDFFRLAGLDIRDGRGLTEGDRAGARRVAVVNTEFARQVWPGQRVIGRCLFVGGDSADCATVVGVVETPTESVVLEEGEVRYYLPLAQASAEAATSDMVA